MIKFTISKYRKGSVNNKFNARLTEYWRKQYYDLFKSW